VFTCQTLGYLKSNCLGDEEELQRAAERSSGFQMIAGKLKYSPCEPGCSAGSGPSPNLRAVNDCAIPGIVLSRPADNRRSRGAPSDGTA
jgi:hypothetical protein